MFEELADIMVNCRRCAVLTGAGISAESGVPTFRGKEGLWGKFRPEELATMSAFMSNPKIVWEWYNWRRDLTAKVQPNPGHFALGEMEKAFEQFTLITQNVDGLHRQAGSENMLELHGNIHRNKCAECNAVVDGQTEIDPDDIPSCAQCGGSIRPDVVWFGEMLEADIIDAAFEAAQQSELFFSVGTSALVQPAASLPVVAKRTGSTLVEINVERTPLSDLADFHFCGPSGEFLPRLMELFRRRLDGDDGG